jgi:5-methylcytosine-specific restriction endonuclease McrA
MVGTPDRIRGTTLQAIRRTHFRRHPYCVACLAKTPSVIRIASELDHVIPLHQGGIDSLNPFVNRQGLCADCHEQKSTVERGHKYRPKSRVGMDGYPLG